MSIDSLNRDMLRLTGLSSGMDTAYVIEGMMASDQYKLDKQENVKTRLEWEEEAYRDVNNKLRNFREEFMSVLSPDTNMYSSSAYNTYDVTMLDSSSAVSITAGAYAFSGKMTINSVSQLAEAAEVESAGLAGNDDFGIGVAMSDLVFAGTALTFDSGEISFSINGQTFTFEETDTLNDVINEVNNNADAGVTMRYSELTEGFEIRSKDTGAASEIEIVNITGNAFAANAADAAFGIATGTVNGQDAMLSIEGVSVTKSDNTFTIDGISYTLKDTSASSISFSIERDVNATMDRITSFIDKYNELVDELNTLYTEDKYYSYDPLTDDQKEQLSDDEQEQWTEMAKSGILRSDSYVSTLLSTMRNSFFSEIDSIGKTPADFGLQTGTYTDRDKIVVDEDTLRSAIENNPGEVASMFISSSDTDTFSEQGLIVRMSDAINNYIEQTTNVALKSISSRIDEAEERIEDIEDYMETREEQLYQRFTTMETTLSTLNSQSSWLATQTSTMFSS